MPLYDVYHITPLSDSQRDTLAAGITHIHSEKFTTPALFVNVVFHDASDMHTYVAGKRKRYNRIQANVRHGPSRTQAMYNELCAEVNALWAKAVGTKGEEELRVIFIIGGLVAGSEAGLSIPGAGEDKAWVKENMEAFKERAAAGDEDFVELLKDVEARGLGSGVVTNGH